MVKKKRSKKSTMKKKVGKSKQLGVNKTKINLVIRNLIIFATISIISYTLYKILNKDMFESLFLLLAMIFAFLSVAFLIVLLTFIILKIMKKR